MMRKSIRKYKAQPVSDELLNNLLTQAEHTQTMGNLQLYSVVVTRSEEMKQKLAPAHFNQPMVKGADVVLTFCADYNRTTQWALNRKAHPGYGNFLSFVNAATDALLYCQRFCDLAEEAGLGLCFLGTTIYQPQPIIDALKLPQLVMPIATITLGWPDETPTPSERLPLSAIRHDETYQPVTAATIDRDYAEKEALPINQHFVAENNVETLAQVFADIRYKASDCEAMSVTLLDALKQQGFL
uniref:nitroreductase family protein n=1 Tax=Alloprevotella sp. TaxID=1872471 RepID=UPI003FEF478F